MQSIRCGRQIVKGVNKLHCIAWLQYSEYTAHRGKSDSYQLLSKYTNALIFHAYILRIAQGDETLFSVPCSEF